MITEYLTGFKLTHVVDAWNLLQFLFTRLYEWFESVTLSFHNLHDVIIIELVARLQIRRGLYQTVKGDTICIVICEETSWSFIFSFYLEFQRAKILLRRYSWLVNRVIFFRADAVIQYILDLLRR